MVSQIVATDKDVIMDVGLSEPLLLQELTDEPGNAVCVGADLQRGWLKATVLSSRLASDVLSSRLA